MTFQDLLLEYILEEGKIDDVLNKYPHISDEDKAKYQGITSNATNLNWLLHHHHSITPEHDILNTMKAFERQTVKSKLQRKQINQYKSIDDFNKTLLPHINTNLSYKDKVSLGTNTLYSSPTMIIKQHHSHESCIEAAKLPMTNIVRPTIKDDSGNITGKATWCVSSDSSAGKILHDSYTLKGHNPVYSIEQTYPDGSTRRHIYVTDNSKRTPEFRNEKQDGTQYDSNFELFAKENPEIMKTPIAQHFDNQFRKKMLINDFLNGHIENFENVNHYNLNSEEASIVQQHKNNINNVKTANKEDINELIKDKKWHIHLAANPNLQPRHIEELLKNEKNHNNLFKNKGIGSTINQAKRVLMNNHFYKLSDNERESLLDTNFGDYIIKNRKLSDTDIKNAIKNKSLHSKLLYNQYLNQEQIQEMKKTPETKHLIDTGLAYNSLLHLDPYENHDLDLYSNEKEYSENIDQILQHGTLEHKTHLAELLPQLDTDGNSLINKRHIQKLLDINDQNITRIVNNHIHNDLEF